MNENKPQNPKALKEFLSEAQEFVEELSNVLMEIDKELKGNEEIDPDIINEAFRCWHTLKGLSSTFGVEPLSALAHREETFLDEVRLGRTELTEEVLDSLLGSVDIVTDALSQLNEKGNLDSLQIPQKKARTDLKTDKKETKKQIEKQELKNIIPNDILEVLTEFEEHRLVTNIQKGRTVYRIRASFSLMSIDTELETIKNILKPLGEILTYLPCDESGNAEYLDIEVLLGLKKTYQELEAAVLDYNAKISVLFESTASSDEKSSPSVEPTKGKKSIEPIVSIQNRTLANSSEEKAMSLRSVSQTVRVDISKLDRLMNSVGELQLVRTSISKVSDELRSLDKRQDLAIELHRIARGFERRLAEVRDGILEVRMVPVSQMFDRLSRVIRKVSRNLGKEIQFIVSGGETEVDKLIIEELSDPLMHIIRNSIDHGIEPIQERTMLGKPEYGTVALTSYQKGNHVLIEVEDDGGGIDGEKILQAAFASGVISKEQAQTLSHREMINLIFLPGITTSKETTEISGRGVGMDVVKTNISGMGGIVEVQSELGIGTKMTITMPVTLAITPALLVSVDNDIYAIPLNTVAEALLLKPKDVHKVMNTLTMTLRGQTLPLCRLDEFFGIFRDNHIEPDSRVVIAELGHRRVGLVVDALVGQQDVIIKSLGPSMSSAGCFTGVTDIGNKKLALVLDTVAIIEEFFMTNDETTQYVG